jgi:hypothetical protein
MPDQQPDRFGPWHSESRADRGRRGDAMVFQLPADQHPQADRGQPVGLSGATFLSGGTQCSS